MKKTYDIAVLGATGLVGKTMISILEERGFPVGKLYPLASERSVEETVMFCNKSIQVIDAAEFDFSKVQIAFFSAGAAVSMEYAPLAAVKGCIVIDNTSQFRNDFDVPLVIPEVNPEAIGQYGNRNIIANPNCSTIQMLVALKPIYDAVGIERINVATYQSVSGAGNGGLEELAKQTANILNAQGVDVEVFPEQISFNVIPHIDTFEENGYTREEMKMFWETQKILDDAEILVNATAVRVPVFFCHSEALHIETKIKITADEAHALLKKAPGVKVMDKKGKNGVRTYPTPINGDLEQDLVHVGRIREDISHPLGLDLWIVADNVRKGAALNAIQIAEILIAEYL